MHRQLHVPFINLIAFLVFRKHSNSNTLPFSKLDKSLAGNSQLFNLVQN